MAVLLVLCELMQNKFALLEEIRTQHLPRYVAVAGSFYSQCNFDRQVLTTAPVLDILVATTKRPSHLCLRSEVFNCLIHTSRLYKTFFAFLLRFSKLTKYFKNYD